MSSGHSYLPGLFVLAIVAILCVGAYRAVTSALDTPTVFVSYETGDCVKVEQPKDSHYSCANLPEKYNRQWSY